MMGGCRDAEPQVYASETTDTYTQEPLRQVDILLVVDSSGSMEEEQQKLAVNFQQFIAAFASAQVDYHIGVVTTDVYLASTAGVLQGHPDDPEDPDDFDTRYITPDTPDAEAVFQENVTVGTNGSGLEMGYQAAYLALSEPLISGWNAGFYRTDASLSIVIFSDEDDMSPGAVDDYLNFFAQLKGEDSYRDHALMNISAVTGDAPFGCEAEDGSGVADAGTRYIDGTTRTEGVFASICAEDFAPIVQALGLDLSGLKREFPLTRCAKPETIAVKIDGRVLEPGVAFIYQPERKSIEFGLNWVPGPGAKIEIHYEFYAETGATCPSD
jgi:hypothetical protein